jgi:hypothetical protein
LETIHSADCSYLAGRVDPINESLHIPNLDAVIDVLGPEVEA